MPQITEHLVTNEVTCKCGCGFGSEIGDLQKKVANLFEEIREQCWIEMGFEICLIINSGCRCDTHNLAVGGRKHSRHTKGQALDIARPEEIPIDDFYNICDIVVGAKGGVGKYENFVHIDCRRWYERWVG